MNKSRECLLPNSVKTLSPIQQFGFIWKRMTKWMTEKWIPYQIVKIFFVFTSFFEKNFFHITLFF